MAAAKFGTLPLESTLLAT